MAAKRQPGEEAITVYPTKNIRERVEVVSKLLRQSQSDFVLDAIIHYVGFLEARNRDFFDFKLKDETRTS